MAANTAIADAVIAACAIGIHAMRNQMFTSIVDDSLLGS
jgi:hypothetical protein